MGTPGYYAFKMFTNYDGQGGKYGNIALEATSNQPEVISVYSSIDAGTGNLHVMLINRIQGAIDITADVTWDGFTSSGEGSIYVYRGAGVTDEEDPGIIGGEMQMGQNKMIISTPGYSITHMILEPAAPESDTDDSRLDQN